MKTIETNPELTTLLDKANYNIADLDSEIRVDQLCSKLLKRVHQYLLQECKLDPLEAGSQAAGADYYLREFMIGKLRQNIFTSTADHIRHFAGNWYIISTLEPNLTELNAILIGTASFYRYCAAQQLIPPERAEQIARSCAEIDYFEQRITDFHNISGDGYTAWDNECPL